jgi:SpoVK/Ycf46/Vps4 family AAA+-type ATPase
MVIMYTVNDTSLIHRTIINRPGRSDKVIEIFPPRTPEEALMVLETRLKRIQDIYHFTIPEDMFKDRQILNVMKRCVEEDFTQAEITNAVAEQAVIDMGVDQIEYNLANFIEYLNKAVAHQLDTRQAIKNCSFDNKDPELKESKCEAIAVPMANKEPIGLYGSI